MRFILGVAVGAMLCGAIAARHLFRGPGDDVLLPPETPPDWRERAKRNSA